ncbi:MAG TPA: hypothetical protein VEK08_20890 [Planctomycetota bacterium]|nr:hypothetical protein [Planctomycetota bacterium]
MERGDDSPVGPSARDFEQLTTRVDSAKERRILATTAAPAGGSLAPAKYALVVGLLAIGGVFAYRHFYVPPPAPPVQPVAAATPETAESTPVVTEEQLAAIRNENTIQQVIRDGKLPEAPKVQLAPLPEEPVVEEPAVADPAVGIIGQPVALGTVAVEVENFWIDDSSQKGPAYAALSGYLVNATDQPMALPQIEVSLLDHEKRLYKSSKQTLTGGKAAVNPQIKTANTWFFELPPNTPMYCAQFATKLGKQDLAVFIQLAERTPENAALVESKEYEPTLLKLMTDASPRAVAAQEYYKAKFALDQIGLEAQALEKQAGKIEKKLKIALKEYDNAKAASEKSKNEIADVKARIKEIEGNRSTFKHNARLQEIELGKLRNELARRERDEASAAETLDRRTKEKTKIDAEFKDIQSKLKTISTKFDAQAKNVDKAKEKLQ